MSRTLRVTLTTLLAASSLLLVACSQAQSGENSGNVTAVSAAPSQKPAAACNTCGVVKSIRPVSTRPQGSGLGAVMGAVVGGLAGSQIGGGTGKSVATVAGVVGGAVAGNNIERNRNTEHYYEVVVALDNGEYKTVTMSNASGLSVGSEVTVDAGTVHLR